MAHLQWEGKFPLRKLSSKISNDRLFERNENKSNPADIARRISNASHTYRPRQPRKVQKKRESDHIYDMDSLDEDEESESPSPPVEGLLGNGLLIWKFECESDYYLVYRKDAGVSLEMTILDRFNVQIIVTIPPPPGFNEFFQDVNLLMHMNPKPEEYKRITTISFDKPIAKNVEKWTRTKLVSEDPQVTSVINVIPKKKIVPNKPVKVPTLID